MLFIAFLAYNFKTYEVLGPYGPHDYEGPEVKEYDFGSLSITLSSLVLTMRTCIQAANDGRWIGVSALKKQLSLAKYVNAVEL